MSKRFARLHHTLHELRRRHVYRVAGAYAICAWLTLQIADIIFPALMVPDWVLSVLVVLAIAGLPFVVILTWIYDLTPEGLVRTPPADPDAQAQEPTHWNWRWLDYVVIVTLLVILAFVLVRNADTHEASQDHSIAVLPFADISPSGDNRYFSDGLSEALMDSLARIPGLQVAARTSSFAFRDSGQDARSLAAMLDVETLLEGSVRRSSDRLRISARLVDGRSGRNLWTETFEATMDDIFTVQDTIARAIAETLKIRQLGAMTLVDVPTRDQRAYDEYLRGRDRLRQEGTVGNIDSAIAHFTLALELDPDFSLAQAGLCRAYWEKHVATREPELAEQAFEACRLAELQDSSRTETQVALGNLYRGTGQVDRALTTLERALENAPNNEEVHAALGEASRVSGDLTSAEHYFRRAIELDPAYWHHHWSLGRVLFDQGRLAEAIVSVQQSIRLQPDSPAPYYTLGGFYFYQDEFLKAADAFRESIKRYPNAPAYANAGANYFYAGDYVQAEAMFRQAVTLTPSDYKYHGFLAESIAMGNDGDLEQARTHYQTAIERSRQALEINPGDHLCRAALAGYLVTVGQSEAARAELDKLEDVDSHDMLTHRSIGMAYLFLGAEEMAIAHFATAVEKGYPARLFKRDPRLQPLFDQPDFLVLTGNEFPN